MRRHLRTAKRTFYAALAVAAVFIIFSAISFYTYRKVYFGPSDKELITFNVIKTFPSPDKRYTIIVGSSPRITFTRHEIISACNKNPASMDKILYTLTGQGYLDYKINTIPGWSATYYEMTDKFLKLNSFSDFKPRGVNRADRAMIFHALRYLNKTSIVRQFIACTHPGLMETSIVELPCVGAFPEYIEWGKNCETFALVYNGRAYKIEIGIENGRPVQLK